MTPCCSHVVSVSCHMTIAWRNRTTFESHILIMTSHSANVNVTFDVRTPTFEISHKGLISGSKHNYCVCSLPTDYIHLGLLGLANTILFYTRSLVRAKAWTIGIVIYNCIQQFEYTPIRLRLPLNRLSNSKDLIISFKPLSPCSSHNLKANFQTMAGSESIHMLDILISHT